MKTILLSIVIILFAFNTYCQNNPTLKFILVPHPRSENRNVQSVLPGIEKINFSKFDMILLGGDLTYYTSISRKSMDYCDSLFNLKSPNTLWTFGNHDLNNRRLIKEYTGREGYYTYYRDNISFLVLDTEQDVSGFKSSYISGSQLEMVKNVCDTILDSGYLVILHHRLLWMIGNEDFDTRIDSVAESTRQLDTTNFYQEVYPLLQKVKNKGIKVICLGGDKSKINIEYSPEDSITFFASTMSPEFSDSENDVLILSYNKGDNSMNWEFVPLDKVEKNIPNEVDPVHPESEKHLLRTWQTSDTQELSIRLQTSQKENARVKIYTITGKLSQSFNLTTNETKTISIRNDGIYIIEALMENSIITKKIFIK